MGERDVARVDVAALLGVAGEYEAVADAVDAVVRTRLAGLLFGGAAAGRMHVARGEAVRIAVDGIVDRLRAVVAGVGRDRGGTAKLRGPLRRGRRPFWPTGGMSGGRDVRCCFTIGRRAARGRHLPGLRMGMSSARLSGLGLDASRIAGARLVRQRGRNRPARARRRLRRASSGRGGDEAALVRQDVQLASMSAAWQGAGAEASREFLRRHGEASADVGDCGADGGRIAGCVAGWVVAQRRRESRRDDGDRGPRRTAGLVAAAQTVTTGAGDRAAASELVDQEVKPFVDNEIRSEWLTAMRSAMAAVADAYDAAVAELTSEEAPRSMCPAISARRGLRHQATAARRHLRRPSTAGLLALGVGRRAAPGG